MTLLSSARLEMISNLDFLSSQLPSPFLTYPFLLSLTHPPTRFTKMKKLLSKAKASFDPSSTSTSPSQKPLLQTETHQPSTIYPPTPSDLYRYRYTHGVNLGSVFVLEKWLSPSMFPSSCLGDSELDAVLSSLSSLGLEATKEKWEQHWRNSVTEEDFKWLVEEASCNGLRIPIGFFTLGTEWCVGTDFEKVGEVYKDSWKFVRELAERAREWELGVLIDFHAVYGGANADAHSGTSTGQTGLWGSKGNLERTTKALGWIARELRGSENLVGVQVVNEACFGVRGMWKWYEGVIEEIGTVDEKIPVYISDGWDLKRALEWCDKRRGKGKRNPVVVDTHKYYTFSARDRSQSPQEIIARIPEELIELDGKEGSLADRGEAQIVVGEWSCMLDGRTWSRVRPEERDGFVR
jgi:aryl-phospho-beta-D-glucosidase BglC (GH1 family)